MAQKKEQIKTPKKELSDEEIATLSDAKVKTLVIRMLTEMVECGCQTEEKVKAMQNEIKKNIRGTDRKGRTLGLKSMVWSRRNKSAFNQNRMKKQEYKNMRRGLRTSRTALNIPISKSYRCQRRRGRARN